MRYDEIIGYACNGECVCTQCYEGDEDGNGDTEQPILYGQSESDSPDNCAYCHRPLGNELTSEGVKYVVEAVKARLRKGTDPGAWRWTHGYYVGMGGNAVLRDWAGELAAWDLDPEDAKAVSLFLFWTRPERKAA